jgi:plastocyanin
MMRALCASLGFVLCGHAIGATVEATVSAPNGNPLEDAVIVLEPLSAVSHTSNRKPVTIEQRDREFVPYVTVIQTGTAVEFPNRDLIKHHIYSFSPPKIFEIKLYAGKPGQPVVFDKPGEVVLGCNIHDWMEAYILVVNSPYFGKSGSDGKASISNVPAGRYQLRLWHPRQKAAPPLRDIEVRTATLKWDLALDVKPRDIKPKSPMDAGHY